MNLCPHGNTGICADYHAQIRAAQRCKSAVKGVDMQISCHAALFRDWQKRIMINSSDMGFNWTANWCSLDPGFKCHAGVRGQLVGNCHVDPSAGGRHYSTFDCALSVHSLVCLVPYSAFITLNPLEPNSIELNSFEFYLILLCNSMSFHFLIVYYFIYQFFQILFFLFILISFHFI